MKEYTEEDLQNAFYKGRETKKLPDGKEIYLRPTFNGYLRELDGKEDPEKNFKKRVQEYDLSVADEHKKNIITVTQILVNSKNVDEGDIKPEAKLRKDLGLDSLDIVEVVMDCENVFKITIHDDLFTPMQRWTFGELINFLEETIKEQE